MSEEIATLKPTPDRAAMLQELENLLNNIYTQKFLLLSAVGALQMRLGYALSVLTAQEYHQMRDRAQSALSLLEKLALKR